MIARRLVIAGVGIAVVLGGAAVVLDQMTAGQSAGSRVVPAAGSSPKAGGPGTGPGTADAAAQTGAGVDAATPTGGTTDDSAPAPGGREVLPPVSASPSGLPMPAPPASLISLPLPEAASAQGKVVDGFPADAIPFPDGTVVVSTGVSPAEGSLQISAEAIVTSSQDSVVGHFQQILGPLQFWSERVPAAEGQQSLRFSRGNDSVTLTTSTTGTGGTRFMLLGHLPVAAGG
ncbi:hypothetical protein J2X01_003277 [Arthrobacter ginsengisoli]|uniref:Sortase n=1 Tax=Arthrobacter ginsengisoli TaxID=1356565 RepID=A0ABU1UFK5_9MICC|nr:hypothetical protein [Arthrobacter ginsengisoli]MDR7083971.1 hypothetical protein [Arthrobacter ginsengisoli]